MSIVAERVTIDHVSEDSSLSPLDLVGIDPSWGIYLLEHDYAPPKPEIQRAGSVDTEGDLVVNAKYPNRTITARVRIFEPEDPASTNLAINPIAALNATTWVGVSLLSGPTRVIPANNPRGKGTSTAVEAQSNAAADILYHDSISVTSGKTYRASLYVQLAALTATGLKLCIYNSAGTKKAESTTFATVNTTAEGWTRLNVSFTADATSGAWRVGLEQIGAGAATFSATAMLVEESATLTPFFCGETPGCDWSGARHASTSTRPAPDGTRFSRIYADVMAKLDRIKREKVGTYRRHAPGFSPIVYDLLGAEVTDAPQDIGIGMKQAEIGLSLEAKPGGRGPEVQIGGNFDEKALPVLSFLAEGVPGDMPGLGRLQLEDLQGQTQLAVWWGLQQRYYSGSADAAPFYEAETRTALGSTASAAAPAGASGGNTLRNLNLVNAYQGIMSTQASGGGNHLAHVGSYRLLARVYRPESNNGEVTAYLAWTEGDFVNVEENEPITLPAGTGAGGGNFWIKDFGIVTLEKAAAGTTQRWEGRILAKSTVAADDIYLDYFVLVPVDEGSGEIRTSLIIPPLQSLIAADAFNQSEGNLAAKNADIGGAWAGAGDADDFKVILASHTAQRVAVSDVEGTPRYETLGASEPTNVAARLRFESNNPNEPLTSGAYFGLLLRYVNTENWVAAVFHPASFTEPIMNWDVYLWKKVAGSKTKLQTLTGTILSGVPGVPVSGLIECALGASGIWILGANGVVLKSGNDADLATGGALAKGKVGLFDEWKVATAHTRIYDSIEVWEPTLDAAIYANQTVEVASTLARRKDSAGVTWGEAPYEGDFLMVPPAGPEQRVSRLVAKASRNAEADAGIDDIRGRLYVQPRYLVAPPT